MIGGLADSGNYHGGSWLASLGVSWRRERGNAEADAALEGNVVGVKVTWQDQDDLWCVVCIPTPA